MGTSSIINPGAVGAITIGTVTVDTISGTVTVANDIEIANDAGNPVPTSSATVVVGTEITRPNDTTAYIAKDVISTSNTAGTILTFSNFSRANGSSGLIVRSRIMTNQATNTGQYKLHLFHTAPTAINDNAPYIVQYTNANNRIGVIEFSAMSTEDATSNAAMTMRPSSDGSYPTPNLWFKTNTGSRDIYGILETTTAFTPTANQKYYIELAGILD